MNGQLRSEFLKQRSTQTALALFVAMCGLVGLAVAMHVLAPAAAELSTRADQLAVFEAGSTIGMLFAALAGAMAITAEIRYGTIRPTFLVSPTRGPVVAAKLVISGLTGVVFGLLAEGMMAATTAFAFTARGIEIQLSSGDYAQLLLGGAIAAGLWATIGLSVGALVRSQVATLVGLCAWLLLIESLLLGFVPTAGRFLPGAAGLALAGESAERLLAPAAGLLLLAIYAAGISAAGWLATLRRDVA